MNERENSRDSAPQIREALKLTVNQLIEQQSKLGLVVMGSIANGDASAEEVSTALNFMEELTGAAKRVVDARGDIIFVQTDGVLKSSDEVVRSGDGDLTSMQKSTPKKAKEKNKPQEPEGPKTFGELLELEIDAFLPDGDKFTKGNLFDIYGKKRTVRNAVVQAGFSSKKMTFTREEATLILKLALKKNRKNTEKTVLSRKEVAASFFPFDAPLLNEISSMVGHDWKKIPAVTYDEALDMRAIKQLRTIVKKKAEQSVSNFSDQSVNEGETTDGHILERNEN